MKKINKLILLLLISCGVVFSFVSPSFAATKPSVDFVDVSHWNSQNGLPVSAFQTLKMGNINGVVLKISDGHNGYIDPSASVNYSNAKAAGMVISGYHFARYQSEKQAVDEANQFNEALKKVGFDKNKDAYVVVDIELPLANKTNLTSYTNKFISQMMSLGYSRIALYTGSSFYNNNLIPSKLNIKPSNVWLARYSASYQEPQWNDSQKGAWQWSQSEKLLPSFGVFDANKDYSGIFTNVAATDNATTKVGKVGSVSLVNYMKSKGMDFSFSARKELAEGSYLIKPYTGSAAQNIALLEKLKTGAKPVKTTAKTTTSKITTKIVAKTYTIKRGDTLSQLSKKLGNSISQLKSLNKISNVNKIYVGKKIKYQVKESEKVATSTDNTKYITVKSGDTVSELAQKYNTSISKIKSLNHLNSHYVIYVGEKIRVK